MKEHVAWDCAQDRSRFLMQEILGNLPRDQVSAILRQYLPQDAQHSGRRDQYELVELVPIATLVDAVRDAAREMCERVHQGTPFPLDPVMLPCAPEATPGSIAFKLGVPFASNFILHATDPYQRSVRFAGIEEICLTLIDDDDSHVHGCPSGKPGEPTCI